MRRFIRSNPLKVAVLIWFSGWLVCVMPGHKRGVVKLPGAEDAIAGQSSCCEPEPSCCSTASTPICRIDPQGLPCTSESEANEESPIDRKPDPARHCAICFLKAHLTEPPPLTFYVPCLGEIDELTYMLQHAIAHGVIAPKRLRGRAPPTA